MPQSAAVRPVALFAIYLLYTFTIQAADSKQQFDLPAGDAAETLKRFAAQANCEIMFPSEPVAGVRTRAIKGAYTPREALERMIAGTELVAVEDRATGALMIVRLNPKKGNGATARAYPYAQAPPPNQPLDARPRTMNRKNPIVLLGTWLALALGASQATLAADSNPLETTELPVASITGQVSNAATRSFLEGALVEIVGTDRVATTDREGRYRLEAIPAGSAVLVVTYTGLDAQRVPVSLSPGQTAVLNIALTAEVYQLERFTVAGLREGTALAETLQRHAPNVKNVISSDAFGNVADGNIGEMLQHIAGITGNYNGPDVYQVSIRGVGPDLNSVTMDGQQVSSSQSANAGRAFEFEQASLGNIERIEVIKAPTPDMDGASIGGSVNLVTKSAFDRQPGRVIRYTIGFTTQPTYSGYAAKWKQPVKGYGPSMNFSYSDIVGEKQNIGITLTGTFHSAPVGGAFIAHAFEQRATPGPVYDYAVTRSDVAGATRARIATGLKIDYRWSDRTIVSLNTLYNYYAENNDTRQHLLQTVGVPTAATPNVLASIDGNGNRIGGGYIHPNYQDGITRVFAHPTLSFSNITSGSNDKSGRTYLISPMVRHRFSGLEIDYSLSFSDAATYYDVSQNKPKYASRAKGLASMRLSNVGWNIDRSRNPVWPTITQTEGPDIYDLDNYSNLMLTQNDRRGYDQVIGGKFDLRKELNLRMPTFIKTGFTAQQQWRKIWVDNRRYSYTGPDGVLGTIDDNEELGQFLDTGVHSDDSKKYYGKRGGIPPWPHSFGVARHQKEYPELWKEDVAFGVQQKLQSLRSITESIAAAYVMGNVKLGKLSVLGGVRTEKTWAEGEGPLNYISPEERARRAAWVGPVTDLEARRRAEAQFGGRTTNKGSYSVVLPGIHLKYEPFAGLVTRASWSTGVGRPPFGSIIPNDTVNDDAETVTRSNPGLEPQYGHNYDLSLEYYFRSQGMIAVSAFRKEISDYIYTDSSQIIGSGNDNGFDGQYAGYRLTTQFNGGSAKIEGLEFSYQQQLTRLPGWLKGMGVYANYTTLRTEGNYGGTTVLSTNSLAGFLGESGNLGISYRGYGFDLRLQAIYRGEYLVSNSTNPALVTWEKAKVTWDWKSRYAITRNVSIFLDLQNMFSAPLNNRFAPYPDRVTSYRNFHTKIVAGITGQL